MSIGIQTRPSDKVDGTVLIVLQGGDVAEVISDLQLDVQIQHADRDGYTGHPSRPLWEYVRKLTCVALRDRPSPRVTPTEDSPT